MKRARMPRVSDEIGRFGRSNGNRPKADDLDGKGGLENQGSFRESYADRTDGGFELECSA